jgi:trehalose synthase
VLTSASVRRLHAWRQGPRSSPEATAVTSRRTRNDLAVQEVEVKARSLQQLIGQMTPERAQDFGESGRRARAAFGDRTIWHVNATAHGGGVAEMLQTLLAYGKGSHIDNRWLVLDGDAEFFAITKRLHNFLHGDPGDGGPLGDDERTHYERVLADNLAEILALIDRRGIVILHDPQTAGMVDGLRATGAPVEWRCHIGRDTGNELTDIGWAFLRPYIERADAFVFSRREYVPDWVEQQRVVIIPPSIDPFSAKNRDIEPATVTAVLATVGLIAGADTGEPVSFERRDGTQGTVRPHTGVITDGPPPPADARIVLQVSRWDRLKDMAGVLTAFTTMAARGFDDAHLVLAGPDVSAVADDPEGAAVFAECRAQWSGLHTALRERVHLAAVPMDDADENAIIINALQRHAYLVVQKSLVEGFGLTVTEAMWKARPIVASRVGGIQDQIVDERDGLLIDPYDLDALADATARLLDDPALAGRLGTAARARVQGYFLGDRHLTQYVELLVRLST